MPVKPAVFLQECMMTDMLPVILLDGVTVMVFSAEGVRSPFIGILSSCLYP